MHQIYFLDLLACPKRSQNTAWQIYFEKLNKPNPQNKPITPPQTLNLFPDFEAKKENV